MRRDLTYARDAGIVSSRSDRARREARGRTKLRKSCGLPCRCRRKVARFASDSEVLEQGGRVGHYGLPGMRERAKAVGGAARLVLVASLNSTVLPEVATAVWQLTDGWERHFWGLENLAQNQQLTGTCDMSAVATFVPLRQRRTRGRCRREFLLLTTTHPIGNLFARMVHGKSSLRQTRLG